MTKDHKPKTLRKQQADLRTYCRVERNGTADVSLSIARPDHRKTKFGLRHAIKLINDFFFSKIYEIPRESAARV